MSGFLLDTHALIWWNESAPELSAAAREAIAGEAEIYVSAASIYEIDLKIARGTLAAWSAPTVELVQSELFLELPLTLAHAARAAALPLIHRDPWDRIIAAQAIAEGLTVISRDPAIASLGARLMW
jgi:PIN domain nuclease of toxin-antitoxin system